MRVLCTDNKMAIEIQYRSGTTAQHSTYIGAANEITVDTTKKTVVVHDGVTAGGFPNAARANADGTISLIKKDGTSAGEVNSAGLFNNTLTSTNTNQALTAAQGKVLNDQAFGVGQTWQDVTASRAKGVTYTNSTGKTIQLLINASLDTGSITLNGLNIMIEDGIGYSCINVAIPNTHTYRIDFTNNIPIVSWSELR